VLIALLFAIATPSADYHWPLDLPRQLSSSFGEHRSGRLHAGIDLRTAGTGRAVYAAESGQVTRVRCSPYGYGKAVYVRFLDGNTAVYAHLESFAEPIGDYVRRAQHAQRKYTVDLYPKEGELRVERGEVIARSGQTGIGVPHLHYEIRDASGRPINPRNLGIDWPDTTPPVIRSVLIAPLSADSRVNGDVMPVIVPVRKAGAGTYTIDGVTARGPIGFGVELVDPANNGASKLGVRSLTTVIADAEQFQMTRDRLSYDTLNNGLVAYHPYLYDRGRYLLQWRWPGNRSEAFAYRGGDGRITVPPEPTTVRLTTSDFHDNAATVAFELSMGVDDVATEGVGESSGSGSFDLECYGEFLVMTATFSLPEHLAPSLSVEGGTGSFFRVNNKIFRAAIEPDNKAQVLTINTGHPRAESYSTSVHVFRRGQSTRTIALPKAHLTVAAKSPYGTLFIRSREHGKLPSHKGLDLVTSPIEIWPNNAPIDENITLSLAIPEGETRQRQLHIYRAGRKSWSRMSSTRTGSGYKTNSRTLGTFAVFADETPPAVGPGKITGSRPRPRIQIPVRDAGSGIDHYEMTAGDQWLLTAYDPERNILEWERDHDFPQNATSVAVRITDAAGNTAATNYQLP